MPYFVKALTRLKVAAHLLSPFEGSPMPSRGSKFTGFKRLHGPEFARPPRPDIEEIRNSMMFGLCEGCVVDKAEESHRLSEGLMTTRKGRRGASAPLSTVSKAHDFYNFYDSSFLISMFFSQTWDLSSSLFVHRFSS
jgi:hypothetical protein